MSNKTRQGAKSANAVVCCKCSVTLHKFVDCSKCKNKYHSDCVLGIGGVYVDKNIKLICCEDITSLYSEKDKEINELKSRLARINEKDYERSFAADASSVFDSEVNTGVEVDHGEEVREDMVKQLTTAVKNVENTLSNKIGELKKLLTLTNNSVSDMKITFEKQNDNRPNSGIDVDAAPSTTQKEDLRANGNLNFESPSIQASTNSRTYVSDKSTPKQPIDGKNIKTCNRQGIGSVKVVNMDNCNVGEKLYQDDRNNKNLSIPLNITPSTKPDGSKQDNFTKISYNRRDKRMTTALQGTGTNLGLRGAAKILHFHVYRLDTEIKPDDIIKHLEKNDIIGAKCEQLQAKYPDEYSSFKLSVTEDMRERVMNSVIWPRGVRINRYFLRTIPKRPRDN